MAPAFFSLPPELRLMVYDYALLPRDADPKDGDPRAEPGSLTSLLLVCRTFHSEAKDVFYTRHFPDHAYLFGDLSDLRCALRCLAPHHRSALRGAVTMRFEDGDFHEFRIELQTVGIGIRFNATTRTSTSSAPDAGSAPTTSTLPRLPHSPLYACNWLYKDPTSRSSMQIILYTLEKGRFECVLMLEGQLGQLPWDTDCEKLVWDVDRPGWSLLFNAIY